MLSATQRVNTRCAVASQVENPETVSMDTPCNLIEMVVVGNTWLAGPLNVSCKKRDAVHDTENEEAKYWLSSMRGHLSQATANILGDVRILFTEKYRCISIRLRKSWADHHIKRRLIPAEAQNTSVFNWLSCGKRPK